MNSPQLTRERDLRDSRPLWIDTPRVSVRSSKQPARSSYDVIIVGAGISAALVANALADGNRSILVIDKRSPVKGSSIASTAMIQHEIDVPLHQLQGMIGKPDANRVWQRSARAVMRLNEIVQSLDISCAMKRKKTLYLAGDELGSRALRTEADARNDAGIKASFLDKNSVMAEFGLDRSGAILSDISASANPGQLTAGLLRSTQSRGVEIVSGLEITALKSIGGEVVAATADGRLLSAGNIVFCTGYEFLETLASDKHEIISTWALASKPGIALPDWLNSHIVWEASDPYLYFRTSQDGRLVVGGEDESNENAYQSASKLKSKTETIRRKVSALLRIDIGEPEYRWAAAFGSTSTGLPLIGEVPDMKNVYSVMGFGGNGITFSQIAAEIVSSAVNGGRDPDADLFAF
jgi:glycine/D-amino acid oxidase-like deaminating enzyme